MDKFNDKLTHVNVLHIEIASTYGKRQNKKGLIPEFQLDQRFTSGRQSSIVFLHCQHIFQLLP